MKVLKGKFKLIEEKFTNVCEFIDGHLGHVGKEIFGINCIQGMMLEKLDISDEVATERVMARAKMMYEQDEARREAARNRLQSVPMPDEEPTEEATGEADDPLSAYEPPSTDAVDAPAETPAPSTGDHEATAQGGNEAGQQEPV